MAAKRVARSAAGDERQTSGAIEATALGTAAGAMALGMLTATAESREQQAAAARDTHEGRSEAAPPPAPDQAHDTAPPSPAVEATATSHADTSVEAAAPAGNNHISLDQVTAIDSTASTESATLSAHGSAPVQMQADGIAASDFTPAADHAPAPFSAPSALPGANAGAGVSDPLDYSLTSLSGTLASLTDSIQQITQSLTDPAQLSDTVSSLTQSALAAPTALAGAVVDGVFGTAHAAPASPEPTMMDSSALVPVTAALAPLALGFMGQPQPDGHDGHDGAFTAHHF